MLQPAHARRAVRRPPRARALRVSDQGTRPGPGAGPGGADAAGPAPGDLRRRHTARRAIRDPAARQRRPHQPRHAARRDPAQPLRLGRLLRQPGRRRRGRGARLPRRVRLARGQRAAPAAPARGGLRHGAALPARLGHDRQPGRARRAPDGPGGLPTDRSRRRTTCAPPHRDVEPAPARRGAGHARLRVGRGIGAPGRPREGRGAHHLLHQLPQGGRAHHALHRRPAARRPVRPHRPVPCRLHPRAAARARAPAGRR